MKTIDVTALGEILIDFTQNGTSEQGNPILEMNPGGAPCNVLAMLRKFDRKTAFIGKVGDDNFGWFLKQKAENLGIDMSHLYFDKHVHTTLAFVHTGENGERDFTFCRNPGADMQLTENEINEEVIKQSKIFHFGTLSMTHEGVRRATKKSLEIAKRNDCLISFDPNIREPLWGSLEEAREQVELGMSYCDILKISDNEIQWFTGEADYSEGVKKIRKCYPIKLILVSMGSLGSRAYYEGEMVEVAAFANENTIETTGAGDTFCGCILNAILDWSLEELTWDKLKEMLTIANGAASLITSKKGALCSMPEIVEVRKFISKRHMF
ncbi:carbohydrate kinase family protein [Candidatus Enterococcus ferrettii]|uniref:Fructokinase n=1 Tax=Candidatus Enterococcus ferrettii TaxID=2815324 RepID=A0ABV0EUC8_9ENTE|nr:carbohydrate kinase [Enterococcus sp. 665A]MBO1339470.1 carbohydrate kinase [Enterococcus sp. 665A]